MAKYDHGGGCPCGLYKTCECGKYKEDIWLGGKMTNMTYIWMRDGTPLGISSNAIELWKMKDFDQNKDKIYQLGSEVRIETKVVPVSSGR